MSDICEVKICPYNSPEYIEALDMRHRLTRIPIGLNLYDEDLTLEKDFIHFFAKNLKTEKVIGTVILVPFKEKNKVYLKQMMVEKEFQKCNVGKLLMKHFFDYCKSKGFESIILYSFLSATGFYLKFGFDIVKANVMYKGKAYHSMEKKLI